MTGKDYLKQLTEDGTKVIFTAADVIEAFEAGKEDMKHSINILVDAVEHYKDGYVKTGPWSTNIKHIKTK